MKIKQINTINIKPIKCEKLELPIKGCDLFPEIYGLYGNIFLCAKKRSGKSTVIYNILKKCVGKNTKVYIFCSTCNKDPAYEKMMDYMDNRSIYYEAYSSISELDDVLEEIKNGSNDNEESEEEQNTAPSIIEFGDEILEQKKYVRKPKYIAPEYIIIFDDLGQTLRSKSIEQLLKTNRHWKCKTIISSQYLNDLNPASRLNLDFCLIFKGMPYEKITQIHKDLDLSVELDKFIEMYEEATETRFNFLYIDTRSEKFRINFNKEFQLE